MTHSDADLRDALCVDEEDTSALPTADASAAHNEEAADAARSSAADAAENGDWPAALAFLTTAILSSAEPSPQLYARRAEALLALRRPTSALCDAAAALALNSDSARALRAKGMAHRMRGEWADGAKALGEAQAIDFKSSSIEVLKLCVDKAAIVQKRHVIEANAAKLAARRVEEEAAAAIARANAPPPAAAHSAGRVQHVKSVFE